MKNLSKIISSILVMVLALSLVGCHPKTEYAYTITDKESGKSQGVTTAQYLYALTNATLEAQDNINNENPDKTIEDYSKYKVVEVDEKDKKTKTEYYKWIEERAEKTVKEFAGSMIKKKALGLKLDESEQANIDSYVNMYWQYYYQPIFEKNGVSIETYKDMFTASYYQNQYFLSIYDKDGTNPVDEKTISKTFYDNYTLADTITISVHEHSEEETEEEHTGMDLDEAKKLLKSYESRILGGVKFADILAEYNKAYGSSEENSTATDPATVYGSDETDVASEYYSKIKKMDNGDVEILTSDDKSEIVLVQKKKIKDKDETYLTSYRSSVLYQIKGDEFEDDFEKFCSGLKVEENSFALGRIKPKKIDTTNDAAAAQTAQ